MLRFKNFAVVIGMCAILSACDSSASSASSAPEKVALLTADQEQVLAEGVEAKVVRDAVDGGIVVTL